MDRNELLNLLGVSPKGPSKGQVVIEKQTGQPTQAGPVSSTALVLDEWDMARGRESKQHSQKEGAKDLPVEAWSDFHASAFLQAPEQVENCTDKRRAQYLKTVLESSEFSALRTATVANPLASEMASNKLAEEFHNLTKGDEQREQKRERKPESKRNAAKEAREDARALRSAAIKAIKQADEEVAELENMMAALGKGPGDGMDGRLDLNSVSSLFKRVKDSDQLRRIIDLAGRWKSVARSKQRKKANHGQDDMVGVECGDNISRLVDSELSRLADEQTEDEVLVRLLDRQAMIKQYRGVENVGRGPIIVCVDESGSMSGEPVCQAKAFSLAMAWIAKHQKRPIVLIGYSGGREGTLCVLRPGKWDESALLEWLGHFYSGGTTMDVPLDKLPHEWWYHLDMPEGKTDLILLTDGIVSVPETIKSSFLEWKEDNKVRCISLILAPSAGQLAEVSDEVHLIRSVSMTESGLDRCLEI